ncbi:MAG: PilZ domain-containing protein [Planctomycetaceae bacterium]|nr:PilZ domain-containing protein [Planctomycetaceae bacterium]
MPTDTARDRRKNLRVKASIPVVYGFMSNDGASRRPDIESGTTVDVSSTGIAFIAHFADQATVNKALRSELIMSLKVSVTESDQVELIGRVAWAAKVSSDNDYEYFFGVEYVKTTEESIQKVFDAAVAAGGGEA